MIVVEVHKTIYKTYIILFFLAPIVFYISSGSPTFSDLNMFAWSDNDKSCP